MVVIYFYLERGNYKVLKFDVNNSSYFEINTSLFLNFHVHVTEILTFDLDLNQDVFEF